jgi:hypothetical protein
MVALKEAECRQCGAVFRTAQGLAGHRRFRHGDAEWSASVDRAQAQRMQLLDTFQTLPELPKATALLIARLQARYGGRRGQRSATDCVVCGAVCKTPQGLSGHMRYRHGAGAQRTDRHTAADLIRYLTTNRLPEPVAEAIWEKVLRLEGFRW